MPWPYWLLMLWPLPVLVWLYVWLRAVNAKLLLEHQGMLDELWVNKDALWGRFGELDARERRHYERLLMLIDAEHKRGVALEGWMRHINRELPRVQCVVRALNRSRRKHRKELDACENCWQRYACDSDDEGFQNSRRFKRIEDALGLEKWTPVRASICHHGVGLEQDCQDCRQEEE